MSIEKDRLLALIEFSRQSACLRGKPAAAISAYGRYSLFEHEIQGLRGIHLNPSDLESEDEVWLSVERLHETRPPDVESPVLGPWLEMTRDPTKEPQLRDVIDGTSLIEAGTHCSSENQSDDSTPSVDPESSIMLSDYDAVDQVRAHFEVYLKEKWLPWAKAEKLTRKTIRLYGQLFTLKQQLEGGIAEAPIELVWGAGIGIWNTKDTSVRYPLIGRLVEIDLDPVTARLEVRPRDVEARLEIDWYASVDNPGVANLDKSAKEFFGQAKTTFSPFDRASFERILMEAATYLDDNGIFWPNVVPAEDRKLPNADTNLKITDTWVLFARPRTNNLFLHDLEKLQSQVEKAESLPPALSAVVTDPATTNPEVELPSFRGVSASYHLEHGASLKKAKDLYFPKPFNDEQVRIAQLLEVSDGVVVQGPPGTGKTHTIANIISHYLAEGKRVLVTSMKDPALAVLREQLPDVLRPLAISLLASEQEGMKQFEHTINKITSEIQGIDRRRTVKEIKDFEESLDKLHSKLASIDRKVSEWAKRNLDPIVLETERITPQDAAREVVENVGQFEWIPDDLGITPDFAPRFSDDDIVRLRESRRALGEDIDYLDASLPQLVEFPDSKELIEVHNDLSHYERLKHDVDKGDVPSLADSSHETLTLARQLLKQIEVFLRCRSEIIEAKRPWISDLLKRLQRPDDEELFRTLEDLGKDLQAATERHKIFIQRPVTIPADFELDILLVEAVKNLTNGKSPFGIKGWLGKSGKKKQLDSIRVLGNSPTDAASWKHVAEYLDFLSLSRDLVSRWNALSPRLGFEQTTDIHPDGAMVAAQDYDLYSKLKSYIEMGCELRKSAASVFPNWPGLPRVTSDLKRLAELEKALRHHFTKNRLEKVWIAKERFQKVLEGRNGRIIERLHQFVNNTLGNPEVEDSTMQAEWSVLMAELSRVHGLGVHLDTVRQICDMVEASGATNYAALLKQKFGGAIDSLLPNNWRMAWRLKRLETYLVSIDAQEELKKLAKDRRDVESDLSNVYRSIVEKRTWLKLAEAPPKIRSALQAYLNAIMKIGGGMGKRAVRYRQDARAAASLANPAIPCWIMAHYRVSESMPPDLGCFDLVVIDEASQSDLTALPALLRAKKVLIVGDDKQVSPEGVGLEEEKVRNLMNRFLGSQVETYRSQMSPDRSIYDLFKVVFAKSAVMLREHFRCVDPIIEYSKREFYNHELRPLRLPKSSERLDPPLVDVIVEDGYRDGDENLPEARFIVDEIKTIVDEPRMANRSIGVVSLLGAKQALRIWELLTEEIGPEIIQQHRITCGDARTFQGKERDIMFLSMVSSPKNIGAPLSRSTFEQRFNVAASRAKDRMYLVRSVDLDPLSKKDRLRRSLINHFTAPFAQDEPRVENLRKLCESPFEREMYDELTQRGYRVSPQVKVGQYRIDLVVEGNNDTRLAVECDGDKYHGPDRWVQDIERQRVLERAGWVFWRCFASTFIRRRQEILDDLITTLKERGIEPIGAEGAPRSVHTERRVVKSSILESVGPSVAEEPQQEAKEPYILNASTPKSLYQEIETLEGQVLGIPSEPIPETESEPELETDQEPEPLLFSGKQQFAGLLFSEYKDYDGPPCVHPHEGDLSDVSGGLVGIVDVEGPMLVRRAYDVYLKGCGIQRMGKELKRIMNKALTRAIRQGLLITENEVIGSGVVFSIVRTTGSPKIILRKRGPRLFDEIPPSELQVVAKYLDKYYGLESGSDEHLRAVLEHFDLKRLTTNVRTSFLKILEKKFPYVDDYLNRTRHESEVGHRVD